MSHMSSDRPTRAKLHNFLLWFCVSLFVLVVNPFHLLDETSSISDRMSNRLYSLLLRPHEESKVVLVAIDDLSINQLGPETGYPLNFDVHSRLLKSIMCSAPSAIFIDIAFQRIRVDQMALQSEEEAIANMASALSLTASSPECRNMVDATRLPQGTENRLADVFIARRASESGECVPFASDDALGNPCPHTSLFSEFGENFKPITLSRRGEFDGQLSYPLISNLTNTLRYDGSIPKVKQQAVTPRTDPSPALALVMARCRQGLATEGEQKLCQQMAGQMSRPDDVSVSRNATLVPTWRYYKTVEPELAALSQMNTNGSEKSSCKRHQEVGPEGPTPWKRMASAFTAVWHGLFNGWIGDGSYTIFGESTCSPYPSITADTLLDLTEACIANGGCSELPALFANKSVIFGYTNQASNDTVKSPVLGFVPGMMLHAAAFDSLAVQGDGYWREARGFSILGLEMTVTGGMITFMLPILYMLLLYLISRFEDHAILLYWIGVSFIGLGVAWLPFGISLTPLDWVAGLIALFGILPKRNYLLDLMDQFFPSKETGNAEEGPTREN